MKQLELKPTEKNVLYKVQEVIKDAKSMDINLLKAIFKQLAPAKDEHQDFRFMTVYTYIQHWWYYVGQWQWKMHSVGSKMADELASKMIQKTFPDGTDFAYPDHGLVFASRLPDGMEDCKFFAEIGFKDGKHSLWPVIYEIDEFGQSKSILDELGVSDEDVRIAYAFENSNTGDKLDEALAYDDDEEDAE